jgi:hypothetical protein
LPPLPFFHILTLRLLAALRRVFSLIHSSFGCLEDILCRSWAILELVGEEVFGIVQGAGLLVPLKRLEWHIILTLTPFSSTTYKSTTIPFDRSIDTRNI